MENGTFGEKRWKNGRKNGRKTALFFTKIQSPVSGGEKTGEIEVSGGLRKIGDFIGLLYKVPTSTATPWLSVCTACALRAYCARRG